MRTQAALGTLGNFEPRLDGSVHLGMCCGKVRRRQKAGDKRHLYKGVIIGFESGNHKEKPNKYSCVGEASVFRKIIHLSSLSAHLFILPFSLLLFLASYWAQALLGEPTPLSVHCSLIITPQTILSHSIHE